MPRRPTDLTKLYYKTVGKVKYGFMKDDFGTGYLLCFVSYKGGPNLIATDEDRGLEVQSCILAGKLWGGKDFWYDTVNPTHGGGNYGDDVPRVTLISESLNHLEVDLPAYDFMPYRGAMGQYKTDMLMGRYPDCGWRCTVTYFLGETEVSMKVKYYIVDGRNHQVYCFRPMTIHLNPKLFQVLENNDKRDEESWLDAVIKDSNLRIESLDKTLMLTMTSSVDNLYQYGGAKPYYSHRCFQENNHRELQRYDGTGDVNEFMYVIEPKRLYGPTATFSGSTTLKFTPLRYGVDLTKMIKNILSLVRVRRQRMNIKCDDGTMSVEDNQYKWLKATNKLVDLSNYPQAPITFAGTIATLNAVLATMPVGWTPPVVEPPVVPPVVPPASDFETEVVDCLHEIIGLLSTMAGQD